MKKGCLLFCLVAILFACDSTVSVKEFKSPSINLVGDDQLELAVILELENRESSSLKLLSSKHKLYWKDVKIFSHSKDHDLELIPAQPTRTSIAFKLEDELFLDFLPVLLSRDSAELLLTSDFLVESDYTKTLINQPATFKISPKSSFGLYAEKKMREIKHGIKVTDFEIVPEESGRYSNVSVLIAVTNEFPFQMELSELALKFFLPGNKRELSTWKLPVARELPGDSTILLDVGFRIKHQKLVMQLPDAYASGKKSITTEGSGVVSKFKKSQNFEFVRSDEVKMDAGVIRNLRKKIKDR